MQGAKPMGVLTSALIAKSAGKAVEEVGPAAAGVYRACSALQLCRGTNSFSAPRRPQLSKPANSGQLVAYQGVPGAYSEMAAINACPNCEALPCEQFEVAFQVGAHRLAPG